MLPGMEFLASLNPLTPYLLDKACVTFGTVIENAMQETVEVGTGSSKRTVPRYKLPELLDDKFQFPREDAIAPFRGLDGYQEVSA